MPLISMMLSKFLFYTLFLLAPLTLFLFMNNKMWLIQWTIMSINSTTFSLPLILDPYGCLFASTVSFIAANVLMFSTSYMASEKNMKRFSYMIMMFILSMNLLIFIPNLISLILGWDGLGLTSFLLVIYYQNPNSLAAGMLTILMNRIGDVMIILAVGLMLNLGQWSIIFWWDSPAMKIFWMLITLAAMTKSAQMPFSSWLPAAMAAPTPVSALVHSSTLVTAGVFLLFRFHYMLMSFPHFNSLLLFISAITMLMAGISALMESDMKKIIALSTLSQLSVMMTSLSINMTTLTFFHLITHAMFKALLFLAAGNLIHFHSHTQDLRFMGNLIFSSPLTLSSLLIANLALCGSPFFAGFYSKDLILEMMMMNPSNMLAMFIIMTATILTSAYSMRFMLILIWNSSNFSPYMYLNDKSNYLTTPMINLSMMAITSGFLMNNYIFSSVMEPILPYSLKITPLMLMFLGFFLSLMISSLNHNNLNNLFMLFSTNMWFLTPLSTQMIINPILSASLFSYKMIDTGWMELMKSQGIFTILMTPSSLLKYSNYTPVTHLLLMSSVTLFIFYLYSDNLYKV